MSGAPSAQDLAAFLQRHPWPADMLAAGAPLEFLWRFQIDAPLTAMWPLIVDTSRFNRALGLPEMHFEERDGRMHGWAINGGFRQSWIEVPWQWVHARELLAIRDYDQGFGRWVRAIYEVQPTPSATPDRFELLVYFGWIPRGWFGRKILSFGFAKVEAEYRRVLAELAASTKRAQPSALYRITRPALDESGEQHLAAKSRALLDAGMPPALVERLAEHLRSADELELARIQPKVLARRWDIEPREMLRLALHATRVGMLDLSWDIVCPHCRGSREELGSLSRIPGESRCDPCEMEFDTRSETSVEVTFRVHATIRKVAQRHWCAAEPAKRDHIYVQLELDPGERRSVSPPMAEGLYRMRHLGDTSPRLLELRAGASSDPLAWTTTSSGNEQRRPNPTFDLHNDGKERLHFIVERAQWSDEAVRPGDLLSLREFRDLFSEDFLAHDVQLAVGMQTVLFTDMVGSTRFYATRGDAEAFIQVRQHFAEMFDIIAAHDGVVVKTIGDAVMAAFVDAAAAIRAAHALQLRFPPNRDDLDIRIRISINRGSCIAVRFQADVDYFGNAVNLAAKLQGSADAGQVAISSSVHQAPGVVAALADLGVDLETLSVDLPALGGAITVLRWTVE